MKLSEAARKMYDLQEYCLGIKPKDCSIVDRKGKCRVCRLTPQIKEFKSPSYWRITQADIERLEREGK